MNKESKCLKCVHMLPFEANEKTGEIRYVCCRYGKRIVEEPENCKEFKKGKRP